MFAFQAGARAEPPAPSLSLRRRRRSVFFGGAGAKKAHFCKGARVRCIGVLGVFWGHLGGHRVGLYTSSVAISFDFFFHFSYNHDRNISEFR